MPRLSFVAIHLIAPSIPAHKTPGSFGPLTAHLAGREFSHGFEARTVRFFRLSKDEEAAVINGLAACMSVYVKESAKPRYGDSLLRGPNKTGIAG